jgi:hypothetical protein
MCDLLEVGPVLGEPVEKLGMNRIRKPQQLLIPSLLRLRRKLRGILAIDILAAV